MTCLLALGLNQSARAVHGLEPQGSNPEVATWRKSNVSALKTAQDADRAMAKVRNAQIDTVLDFVLPARQGKGHFEGLGRIGDSNHYAVRFAGLSFRRADEGWFEQIWCDGKSVAYYTPKKKKAVLTPKAKFKATAGATIEGWVFKNPLYILSGTFSEAPITQLVQKALAKGSGMDVVMAERVVRRLNKSYPQYQITMRRTPAAAALKGDLFIAITVDGTQKLPLLFSSTSKLRGKEPYMVQNKLAWKFSRKAFKPSEFKNGAPIIKE